MSFENNCIPEDNQSRTTALNDNGGPSLFERIYSTIERTVGGGLERGTSLIEQLLQREKAIQKQAEAFTNLIGVDGKFSDRDKARAIMLEAYHSGNLKQLSTYVNKQLEGSNTQVKFDDSMAGIQDIGYLGVQLIDKKTGTETDSIGIAIHNWPQRRIDPPVWPPRGPGEPDCLPDEQPWPRLDIEDRRIGKWGR